MPTLPALTQPLRRLFDALEASAVAVKARDE